MIYIVRYNGWGNGGKRKRPKGVGAPMGQVNNNQNYTRIIRGER